MPLNRSSQSAERAESTIYAPQYLATTLGMFVLVFLVAFESMAVTTVTRVLVCSENLQEHTRADVQTV
jgi:hypothetical protein